ncbi:MAG: ATP-binding cassette domain-containing protein, partial [Clostridia bacterium]|nr:ATP-binding cassette domain-containing protein [Clostridia bacterium]
MRLLEVSNLCTSFFTPAGEVKAIDDVSFTLDKGTVLGIVGESGSGKSVTSRAILGLVDRKNTRLGGVIRFDGRNLLALPESEMRSIRGKRISMIF